MLRTLKHPTRVGTYYDYIVDTRTKLPILRSFPLNSLCSSKKTLTKYLSRMSQRHKYCIKGIRVRIETFLRRMLNNR